MKRYKANGSHIKELRQRRERCSTQKEFAHEIGISERQLRSIENGNAEITADVLNRIAKALGVPRQAIVFAVDGPRMVPSEGREAAASAKIEKSEPRVVPRIDTGIASVVQDEAALFEDAKGSHAIVPHILTKLTSETEVYADELLELLESISREKRDPLMPIDGRQEMRLRRRIRELLVLLKGNDVWVYTTTHTKYLPESDVANAKRDYSQCQLQVIIAFGPPGEYGEETVEVTVDHGQPWIYDPNLKLF